MTFNKENLIATGMQTTFNAGLYPAYTDIYTENYNYLDDNYYDIETKRRYDAAWGVGEDRKEPVGFLGEIKVKVGKDMSDSADKLSAFLNKLLSNIVPDETWK